MCCAISLGTATAQTECYRVIPLPQEIVPAKGDAFTLAESTQIVCDMASDEAVANADFLATYLRDITGMSLTVAEKEGKQPAIQLVIDPKIDGSEAYSIEITKKGVKIKAATEAGLFYGVQTLRKAVANIVPQGVRPETVSLPAATINDKPRFGYRGMMLDCSRHFFGVDFVKKYIDILALHNMNVFHWHITDDQGWRIEIKKYPRLTEVGGWRTGTVVGYNSMVDDSVRYGGYYTQAEAREIVAYAAQRHITVVPEIDMPGHMKAALTAYPELGCTGGPYEVGHRWGVYRDILCLGNEQIYTFCEDVLSEIMDIFPSKLIHIGGDEAPKDVVMECPKCQALMAREGLNKGNCQGYFTNRIEKFVNSCGRSIMGWDEILEGDINQSATIHAWRGIEHAVTAANQGHDVVLSPTSHCYFDFAQIDKPNSHHEPSNVNPGLTVEKVYSLDPLPEGVPESALPHILGVQANLWTEYVGSTPQVEYMLLPRMAALCEVQWSAAAKDFSGFVERLTSFTRLYRLYGLTYAHHLWPDEMVSPWKDI